MDQTLDQYLSRLSLRHGGAWAPRAGQERVSLASKEESLRGRILSLAMDQHGCRILQNKLENNPKSEETEVILCEVLEHVGELVKDQTANYFIQRLIKACDERQRTRIVFSLCKTQFLLIRVCLNQYGTRAIQKLLECVTSQTQVSLLISAISPGTILLSVDPNGHHVIQHCLMRFSDQDNEVILSALSNNCYKIATSKSGCCVLQTCVEHCQGEYRERILTDIIAGAQHLSEDPYGNYVVQHIVGLKVPEILDNLLSQLEGNFLSMACNKYASNVVEKLLTESGTERSTQIIIEMLRSEDVCLLLVHPFGNFVFQSALVVSRGYVRNTLITLVRMNTPFMQTNHYGKKVLEKLDKMALGYL